MAVVVVTLMPAALNMGSMFVLVIMPLTTRNIRCNQGAIIVLGLLRGS
jgi:hypothetical protein